MAAHKWEPKNQHMQISDQDTEIFSNIPPVLSATDAERLVESLVKFRLEDVGSSKWMEQHESIEKLNLQAHHNAMTCSDEYVLESILTFGKIDVLIHDLVIIEAWKEHVYPKLIDYVAGRNNMRIYFILYHEASLINLFEILFYHKHVCEAGGEIMIELVDYAARKLTKMISGHNFREFVPISENILEQGGSIKEFSEAIENRSPKDELKRYLQEIEFKVCISSCAIARFLCENAEAFPLSVVSRITDTHDLLLLFLPLIENPPWTRRLKDGRWQKLIDNKWKDVQPIDLLKLTKLEGQPWLALYHLLAKKIFRDRYHLNTYRKEQLLRVRKYLNEVLLDQLPVLADIQRYMDELSMTAVPDISSSSSVFLFQQVAVLRESLLQGKNWESIADYQKENIFTMTDKNDRDLKRLADLYADDLAENVLEPQGVPGGYDGTTNTSTAAGGESEYEDL